MSESTTSARPPSAARTASSAPSSRKSSSMQLGPGDRLDRLQVDAEHPADRPAPCARRARSPAPPPPAPSRPARSRGRRPAPPACSSREAVVDLDQLVGGPAAVALGPRPRARRDRSAAARATSVEDSRRPLAVLTRTRRSRRPRPLTRPPSPLRPAGHSSRTPSAKAPWALIIANSMPSRSPRSATRIDSVGQMPEQRLQDRRPRHDQLGAVAPETDVVAPALRPEAQEAGDHLLDRAGRQHACRRPCAGRSGAARGARRRRSSPCPRCRSSGRRPGRRRAAPRRRAGSRRSAPRSTTTSARSGRCPRRRRHSARAASPPRAAPR